MDRDQAVGQIQQTLGFRSDLITNIENGLILQQAELENSAELPFFLRKEVLNLTTTADAERLTPPADFLKEWDEDGLYVLVTEDGIQKWQPLEKDGPKYLRESINNQQTDAASITGQPKAYAYDGTDFLLFPTPNAIYTMRMIYYGRDAVLSSNIQNKWLTHLPYLLIGRAGAEIAAAMGHDKALAIFGSLISEGTVRLNALTVSRDGAARRYIAGGPDN